MVIKKNLDFEEITKEAREHYEDLNPLVNFDEKQKKQFFKDKKQTLEKFIFLMINTNFSYLSDTQVYYSLIGPFYELLIKLCVLKENWQEYLKDYNQDKRKRDFEYTKNTLMKALKNKNLQDDQINRIKDILNFIQVQRNNFLHSPFKGWDHYAVQTQMFELIALLDDIFKIEINDDLLFEMLNQTFFYKRNNSGMDFEDVFENKIMEIYKNLRLREKELDELIEQKYENITTSFFEHDDGEFYPKKIKPVEVGYIPPPEPHVLITDLYKDPQDWYPIYTLIGDFTEQAFLSYGRGYYHASISCAINCCEYVLKYEFMRRSPREYAKNLIENKRKKGEPQFALGFFTGNNSKNLNKLRIRKKFEKKLNFLNDVRIALYHFNPKKIKNVQKKGRTFIEKIANPITDELEVNRTAYKAYNIMKELVENFYNEKTRIKFIKEGLKDYKKGKKLAVEEAHNLQFEGLPKLPKEFIEGYMEKKNQFIEKEYLKNKKEVKK